MGDTKLDFLIRDAARKRKHYVANRVAVLQQTRKWHLANQDRMRIARRKWQGLPEPTRPEPDVCEICGGYNLTDAVKFRCLGVDHDHKSGKFRGWLCDRCNRGIGFFRDDPSKLRRAADYLERAALA